MNIQPGRMTNGRRITSARRDPDFGRQFGRVVKAVFGLVLIASVLVVHIYMNQRITETERRIRALKLNINRIHIEITNLRNRYEERSSQEAIRRQMARFALPLVPAEPGQVTAMAILPPPHARNIAIQLEQQQAVVASAGKNLPSFRSMKRD